MSEDNIELNKSNKAKNSSNENKLDSTTDASPKKMSESKTTNDKQENIPAKSEKKVNDDKTKDFKDSREKKIENTPSESSQKVKNTEQKISETKKVKDTGVKKSDTKVAKTLTASTNKIKKVNNSDNKQNNAKFNQTESNNKINEQPEYIEKLVSINRVAKVVKGGRRFSFAALVVVGDGNGMVGHGKGKAKEVPEAIKKATDEAKTRLMRVPLRQGRTLHHDIKGRFDSGKVYLRSAPSGTGVIAGGPMRAVFEALGIQDIVAKSVGTSNPHNMVRATFEALKSASSPKIIAARRGLKINDITKRRKISQGGVDGAKN